MWNHACPLCFAKVPRILVLTRAEELVCPLCHAPLELSRYSRVVSATAGILAGFAAVHFVLRSNLGGRWVLPLVGAILAYALASALVLFFLSDLAVRPEQSPSHFPQSHG